MAVSCPRCRSKGSASSEMCWTCNYPVNVNQEWAKRVGACLKCGGTDGQHHRSGFRLIGYTECPNKPSEETKE